MLTSSRTSVLGTTDRYVCHPIGLAGDVWAAALVGMDCRFRSLNTLTVKPQPAARLIHSFCLTLDARGCQVWSLEGRKFREVLRHCVAPCNSPIPVLFSEARSRRLVPRRAPLSDFSPYITLRSSR